MTTEMENYSCLNEKLSSEPHGLDKLCYTQGQFPDDPGFVPDGLLLVRYLVMPQPVGRTHFLTTGSPWPCTSQLCLDNPGPWLRLCFSFSERLHEPSSPNWVFLRLWLTRHQQQIQHQQEGFLSDVGRNYAPNHQVVHCTPFPPRCAVGHPSPPSFRLEGGTAVLSSPKSGSSLAAASGRTCRSFRLRRPCWAGRKPSDGQKAWGGGREGSVAWYTATPVNLICSRNWIGNVLHLCPLKLWSRVWAWKPSIWATLLLSSLLVSFAMNSKKATNLPFESFLPSPMPPFIFIALKKEGNLKWMQEIMIL